MKSLFLRWGVLYFAIVCLFSFALGVNAQSDLGGFTPNPEVTLNFEKSEYAPGSSPYAKVMITGPVSSSGKEYRVSISNETTGKEITSIKLTIGGAPGSNEGKVAVALPGEEGEVTIVASFSIGDNAAKPDKETLTLKKSGEGGGGDSDTTPPSISIVKPEFNATYENALTGAHGYVHDNEGGSGIKNVAVLISRNGSGYLDKDGKYQKVEDEKQAGPFYKAAFVKDGKWSINIALPSDAVEGTYHLKALESVLE